MNKNDNHPDKITMTDEHGNTADVEVLAVYEAERENQYYYVCIEEKQLNASNAEVFVLKAYHEIADDGELEIELESVSEDVLKAIYAEFERDTKKALQDTLYEENIDYSDLFPE